MNVVLVVLDTARARDATAVMPTLGEIGAAGTRFPRAYSSAPWTLPSHASLFTGRPPSDHGAHGDSTLLPASVPSLPETLAGAGYETVGVSNNTWITDEFGFARGFETFRRGWQYVQSATDLGAVAHELDSLSKARTALTRLFDGNPLVNGLNLWYSLRRSDDGAERTTDFATRWLRTRAGDRPFFLFLNYLEPHLPYSPPRRHATPFLPTGVSYERARSIRQDPRAFDVGAYSLSARDRAALRGLYRGALSYVDAQLGRLRAALVDAGEWENTLVVVLGDHGENICDHGFLGHQYSVYDTVLHVPLVIHGGPFTDGGTVDGLVQPLDVAPTVLEALGLADTDLGRTAAGRTMGPGAPTRSHVAAEYVAPQPSVARLETRFGPLDPACGVSDRSLQAVRTDTWKLIAGADGHTELYHVGEDPGETVDRSAANPGTVERLERRLTDWDALDEPDPAVDVSATTAERLAHLGYR